MPQASWLTRLQGCVPFFFSLLHMSPILSSFPAQHFGARAHHLNLNISLCPSLLPSLPSSFPPFFSPSLIRPSLCSCMQSWLPQGVKTAPVKAVVAKKPPRTDQQGSKWFIENHDGNRDLSIMDGNAKTAICMVNVSLATTYIPTCMDACICTNL